MLIQVSEGLYDQKVREREVNALQMAMKELKINNAYILTEDEEEEIKTNDGLITVYPIYKWFSVRHRNINKILTPHPDQHRGFSSLYIGC